MFATNEYYSTNHQSGSEEIDGFIDQLLSNNKLTEQAIERARRTAAQTNDGVVLILSKLGLLTETDLLQQLSEHFHLPVISSAQFPDKPILEDTFNQNFLRYHHVLPISNNQSGVVVAVADPSNKLAIRSIELLSSLKVECVVATLTDIDDALTRLYGDNAEGAHQAEDEEDHQRGAHEDDVDRLEDIGSDAPVIKLVHSLISEAIETGASDIHIEPFEDRLRVRFRYDGMLREARTLPKALSSPVASRIKIMARLNIAERRMAQDGRLRHTVRGQDVDIRVSSSPTIYGESLVLRILDRGRIALDFGALGFSDENQESFRRLLKRPHGIILVTGPTGSGKTTSLYTALLCLNDPSKKILTIEDPVEYQLDGINQQAVLPQIGRTFAGALRAFLRQDPDTIMVGEIRDTETAQIAVQAALTGHLILATLHTNDAASAIPRLLDMGVDNYLLTSTVVGVLAQRLVRRLCENCCEPYSPPEELKRRVEQELGMEIGSRFFYRAVGCPECHGTGYKGRTIIAELLEVNDAVRASVIERAGGQEIRQAAMKAGMQTLYWHGLTKVLLGETSLEEVSRVVQET